VSFDPIRFYPEHYPFSLFPGVVRDGLVWLGDNAKVCSTPLIVLTIGAFLSNERVHELQISS
jgi:hypothetical protein